MLFCQQGCAQCGEWREPISTTTLYVQCSDDKSWIHANLCDKCFAQNKFDLDLIRKNLCDSELFCSPASGIAYRLGQIKFIDEFKYNSAKHHELRKRLGLTHG